jgi:hypothetical protein
MLGWLITDRTLIGAVHSSGSPGYLDGLGHEPELHTNKRHDTRLINVRIRIQKGPETELLECQEQA